VTVCTHNETINVAAVAACFCLRVYSTRFVLSVCMCVDERTELMYNTLTFRTKNNMV